MISRFFSCLSLFSSCVHSDLCAVGIHLSERTKAVEIPCYVRVEDIAVMLCHIKRTVSQQLLERKSITAAIDKIFASERMPEQVNACFLNSTLAVVMYNAVAQSVFRELFAVIAAKEIVFRLAAAYAHILPQNTDHL